MEMQTTLIILKPDALQRGLAGEILSRFERKGLQIAGARMVWMDQELARQLYEPHKERDFFDNLVRFITSGPVIVLALRGLRAIEVCRSVIGDTFGFEAAPGSIRGDFGASRSYNLVHGSDSPASAERELRIFFTPEELLEHKPSLLPWIYDPAEELGGS